MYIDKREKNMLISQFFLMITPSPRAHPNFPIQRFDPTPMTCSGAKPHEATTFCRSSVHNGWSNLGEKKGKQGEGEFFICDVFYLYSLCFNCFQGSTK